MTEPESEADTKEEKIDIEVRPAITVRESGNELTAAYWDGSSEAWVTNAGEKCT